eukprot:175180_1
MIASRCKTLQIASLPSSDDAYKNSVYVSKSDALVLDPLHGKVKSAPSYVQIGESKKIFLLLHHRKIEAGDIGLSSVQRKVCGVGVSDAVAVTGYSIPENENLNLMKLGFSLKCAKKLPRGTVFHADEDQLVKRIHEKLYQQVFCQGSQFIIDFQSTPILLSVIELKVASISKDDMDDSVYQVVPHGVITKHTGMTVIAADPNSVKIKAKSAGHGGGPFGPQWRYEDMGIGGLDTEFANIFRRAFASRTLPTDLVKNLGIEHVRGLLLYGPPGTGKTLIARQIGKMLQGREPKLVNGPEILNKYVGQSEENIRKLFLDAEQDQKSNGDNADLHIIIFDEIDAICKTRGTGGGGTGVHDTVVNQLLSKMDGVDSLNNILVIGMTNRKDMIDDALLRPGRFEVHIEIGLPDESGRLEILKIHTKRMREHSYLDADVDFAVLAERTKNFTGAEIAGLIKSTTSFAYYGNMDIRDENIGLDDMKSIKVNMAAFERALGEVKPAYGVSEDDLMQSVRNGIIEYGEDFIHIQRTCRKIIQQVKTSTRTPLQSILLEGRTGSGMTAMAAQLAIDSEFPYTKLISPEDFVGYSEAAKCAKIAKIFDDAYRSPLSLIVLDCIELLLGYVDIGPRFSNAVLQTLLVLVKKMPPPNKKTGESRRLLIIGTTSSREILDQMGLLTSFNVLLDVPHVKYSEEYREVFRSLEAPVASEDLDRICLEFMCPIGIKRLIMIIEMTAQQSAEGRITYDEFMRCARDCGLDVKFS